MEVNIELYILYATKPGQGRHLGAGFATAPALI